MGRYFGTDGIRGIPGEFPLDPETLERLGMALVEGLREEGGPPRILIGQDTRESGAKIARSIAEGILAQSGSFQYGGVLPTAGVAFLTRHSEFELGVMISASHNPPRFNGVKVLNAQGFKFSVPAEEALEARLGAMAKQPIDPVPDLSPFQDATLRDQYVEHLCRMSWTPLDGLRIVLDTANGALAGLAGQVFERLGAHVACLGDRPDGNNINVRCGSEHPERLASTAINGGHPLGFAFDGDGDRVLLFGNHRQLDGDFILYALGKYLHTRGELANDQIVATVMSNGALTDRLKEIGIELIRCPVGDRNVLSTMLETGSILGGEQSGHIIYLPETTTGDGLLTALKMASLYREWGELPVFHPYPQILLNVSVKEKPSLEAIEPLQVALHKAEERLRDRGRVLVRYSGTEPLVRIMVEGEESEIIGQIAEDIALVLDAELG